MQDKDQSAKSDDNATLGSVPYICLKNEEKSNIQYKIFLVAVSRKGFQ